MTFASRIQRRPLALSLALALAFLGGTSLVASAKDDDRSAAEVALREVEADAQKKALAEEPLRRAREALERARSLRDSRDEPRARLVEGLARSWAEAARDLGRAVDVERRAEAQRRSAMDAGAQAERERALLEEGLGQSGRLKAQLEALEKESKEPERTSAVAKTPSPSPSGKAPAKPPGADASPKPKKGPAK